MDSTHTPQEKKDRERAGERGGGEGWRERKKERERVRESPQDDSPALLSVQRAGV